MRGEVVTQGGHRVATPEYRSWQMMKNRCLNPRAQDWAYYGGRGITIDPRWSVFDNFLADMGRQPEKGFTIERKDGTLSYCKSNCMWATRRTQSRNRAYVKLSLTTARAIRADQRYQTVIAREYGVSQALVSQVKRGVAWAEDQETGQCSMV